MDDPRADLRAFRQTLRGEGLLLGAPVVFVPFGLVPPIDFADLTHVTHRGAVRWTDWLGGRILAEFPTPPAPVR